MSTKTETNSSPKTEIPFPTFDPMAAWGASQQAFQKIMADAQGRAQAFADEYAQLEAQMFARAKAAVEAWAKLAQDALDYSAQLTAQARKLGFETARKMGA